MKTFLRSSLFALCCVVAALATDRLDRRPSADALLIVSANRADATSRDFSARVPTVGAGATFTGRDIKFDGTSTAAVTYPDDVLFEAAPFTVMGWVKVNPGTTTRINLIGKNDNSGNYPGWFLHWAPTTFGICFATVENSASSYRFSYVAGTTGYNDGVFRHIAVTCGALNSNATIFINGVQQTVTTSNAGTVTTIANSAPLRLAGLNFSIATSTYLNGSIDDALIFNRALTAFEVMAAFSEGHP